jgi:hypothetical protein
MGKKCIPGLFCIDNMTLFLGILLCIFILYFSYRLSALANKVPGNGTSSCSLDSPSVVVYNNTSGGNSRYEDPLSNPYVPPEQIIYPVLPAPIATQPYSANYTQIGILTRKNTSSSTSSSTDILPLMGRRQRNSRDKWQYYTMSGGSANGNIQTKLPIRVNGKSASGEYGCDEIYTNDVVFVEGYKDHFIVTVYENNMFSYVS